MTKITSRVCDKRLIAPQEFWNCICWKTCCNGCGPKGFGWMIPDSYQGICATTACNIHDCMYRRGSTRADRKIADTILRKNLQILGFRLAWVYYFMVRIFGRRAFTYRDDCFRH